MNIDFLNYWFWIGTLYLIIMTYQDIKNKMMVDDRHNYFMLGLTVSIGSHIVNGILYVLSVLVVVMVGQYFIKRYKLIGDADVSALMWLFMGFAFIAPNVLLYFILVWGCLALFQWIALKSFRINKPVAHFPIILLAFILTGVFIGGF